MALSNRNLGITLVGVWMILNAIVSFGVIVPGLGFIMGIVALAAGLLILINK